MTTARWLPSGPTSGAGFGVRSFLMQRDSTPGGVGIRHAAGATLRVLPRHQAALPDCEMLARAFALARH
jgi:hypothetical protein